MVSFDMSRVKLTSSYVIVASLERANKIIKSASLKETHFLRSLVPLLNLDISGSLHWVEAYQDREEIVLHNINKNGSCLWAWV